jgi:hypothetical protein
MFSYHPSDDSLESYLLQHVRDPELGEIEEHLLFCSHCQHRTEKTQKYLDALAAACTGLAVASRGGDKVLRLIPIINISWRSLVIAVPPGLRWYGALAGVFLLLAALNLAWLSSVRNGQRPREAVVMSHMQRSEIKAPSEQPSLDAFQMLGVLKRKSRLVRRRPPAVAKRALPPYIEFPPVPLPAQMPQALILFDPPPILVASATINNGPFIDPIFELSPPPPRMHFMRRTLRAVLLPFRKFGELLVGL